MKDAWERNYDITSEDAIMNQDGKAFADTIKQEAYFIVCDSTTSALVRNGLNN